MCWRESPVEGGVGGIGQPPAVNALNGRERLGEV